MSRLSWERYVTGVSWDGSMVVWESKTISRAESIRSVREIVTRVRVGACGRRAGAYEGGTSSCNGAVPERERHLAPLPVRVPCPCTGSAAHELHVSVPHEQHISPHQSHRLPVTTATPVTVSRSAPMPVPGMLPITGVNLAGLMGAALGLLLAGTGALFGAARTGGRRTRRGPA